MFTLSNRSIVLASAAVLVVVLGLFAFHALASANTTPNAEALLQQAKEAREAAHKIVCTKLGSYVNDCFNGDIEACKKLDNGIKYHLVTFQNFTDDVPLSQVFVGELYRFVSTCRADSSFQ